MLNTGVGITISDTMQSVKLHNCQSTRDIFNHIRKLTLRSLTAESGEVFIVRCESGERLSEAGFNISNRLIILFRCSR